jgi:colanic acid/amylovoran biosynthesis glycosyltransferase
MTEARRHLGYVLKRFPRISETFVALELIELERQGEDVTVFAVSRPREPFAHGFVDELAAPVVYLPYRPVREPVRVLRALVRASRRNPRGFLAATKAALWPPRRRGLRRLLQASVLRVELDAAGIDHVHAHFATTAARLANLAWRMGGPTYSVTAHAKDIYHRQVRVDRLRDKLMPAVFVATVSDANRRYLEGLVSGCRVHVVPNAVDATRLRALDGANDREPGLVLSVARLVEKKGLADLVDACAILRRRGTHVRLEIAGDGPLRPELESRARRKGVDAVFWGALPHEQIVRLYESAAVFCLPCVVASTGDRDGLPTSALEAMALGVPVVSTAVNGLGELVLHQRTGLVVPERDPAALAEALGWLLHDRELADRLAAAARQRVEQEYSLGGSVALLRTLIPAGRSG